MVRWLEPGQVKSRRRRADRASGNGKAMKMKMDKSTIMDDGFAILASNGTSHSDKVAVPPLSKEFKSPFHAMMEAVEYCK